MNHPPAQAVWVAPDQPLPDPRGAMPEGLVAVGRDLSVARLRQAYERGMFPWFNAGDPVLWWCPDPRLVLACADFKVSRSLGKKLRQMARQEREQEAGEHAGFSGGLTPCITITTNLAFGQVLAACAAPREKQGGTWIVPSIQQAYTDWHHQRQAQGGVHSVEVWHRGELTGGLYGVCLGRMFFGESMFSRASDASKLALAYLVARLRRLGITHIDCQQQTPHLCSLGARPMSRVDFLDLLAQACRQPAPLWGQGRLLADGRLLVDSRLLVGDRLLVEGHPADNAHHE